MTETNSPLAPEQAFLATASHEIRTPLNGILGTVSLLLETELTLAQREYAEAIRLSGARLLDMLNNMLDYARLDAGETAIDASAFSPLDLAQEVAELLSPRAHNAGLDLAVRGSATLPSAIISDGGKLRQILFNLIGNALKFTQTGSILVDLDHADGHLIFKIRDTGPGIAAGAQANLFQAFKQVGASDAEKDGGVGLGLAIVARLIDLLGGRMDVFSAPGDGSCFEGRLPAPIAAPAMPDISARGGQNIALVGLPPATGLNAGARLIRCGYTVRLIAPPEAALCSKADLFIADAALPEALLEALCASRTTLIVLRPEDRSALPRFRELGMAGWLVRPLRADSLEDRVKLALSGSQFEDDEKQAGADSRIVIADDNPINALIARRALESAGFSVVTASTGREALDVIAQITPQLVFMDLRMPVMDGFEAIRNLRAGGNKVPVIAISAEINPEIERRARLVGADGVAAKPLDASALRRLAFRWIGDDSAASVA